MLLAGARLELFSDEGNGVYNFRCPFCLDSKKNKNKKRGYFYPKNESISFKCHNCGRTHLFNTFLMNLDNNLYHDYKIEKFGKFKPPKMDFLSEKMIILKSRETDPLGSCIKLCDIQENLIEVKKYAIQRGIPENLFNQLYAASNLNEISNKIEKYNDRNFAEFPVLVIPFFRYDLSYSYIQCRTISDNGSSGQRFTTFELDENAPKLWGEFRVNWHKPVYVLEGPIDAMFIDNGLAMAGASVGSSLNYIKNNQEQSLGYSDPKSICLCYDNDYLSNAAILLQVNKRINEGYSVVLYDKSFKWKDINDAHIIGGWDLGTINKYIVERTFTGLNAKLELAILSRKFKR